MPGRKSKVGNAKQEPPIAFRPGPELAPTVAEFSRSRSVGEAECYKQLAALAMLGFDVRYYDLVAAMGANQTPSKTFVRNVFLLHTTLQTAIRINSQYVQEPFRTEFLIKSVDDQLKQNGTGLALEVAQVLLQAIGRIPISWYETQQESASTFQSTPSQEDQPKLRVKQRAE
jgi:hypothetical protein